MCFQYHLVFFLAHIEKFNCVSISFGSKYHAIRSISRLSSLNIDMFRNGIYPNNKSGIEYFLALTSPSNIDTSLLLQY